VLLLAHTGIGSAVNVLRYRLVTHCAGSVEPGALCPFNTSWDSQEGHALPCISRSGWGVVVVVVQEHE